MGRPYSNPRPRQHNAHVWAYVNNKVRAGKLPAEQAKAVNERLRKTARDGMARAKHDQTEDAAYAIRRALTSGGRGLGRFGKW